MISGEGTGCGAFSPHPKFVKNKFRPLPMGEVKSAASTKTPNRHSRRRVFAGAVGAGAAGVDAAGADKIGQSYFFSSAADWPA